MKLPDRFSKCVRNSLNKFQTVAPALLILFSSLQFTSCGSKKDGPIDPIEVVDRTPPEFTVFKNSNIDVTGGKTLEIKGNVLYIGGEPIVSRGDKESQIKLVKIYFNGNEVGNGYKLNVDGEVKVVTRNEGNLSSNTTFNVTTNAPEITRIEKDSINVFFGGKIEIFDNCVKVGGDTVFSWDRGELTSLTFNGIPVDTGYDIFGEGELKATVIDGKESSAEITVINSGIEGLDVLENLDIKAGQTINLRDYIKPVEGCEISDDAVLVPEKGEKQAVKLSAFSVDKPGNYTLIIKVFDKSDNTKSKTVETKISISAAPSTECNLSNADLSSISWFNKLSTADKNFIGPLLRLSLISALHENKDRISIIAGENSSSSHAATAINYISNLTNSEVIGNEKLNGNNRAKGVVNYADNHPDKKIFVSCAIASCDLEWLRELYKRPNVCVLTAIGNNSAKGDGAWVILNEDVKLENKGGYRTSTSSNSSWYYKGNTDYKFGEYQKSSYNSGINNHYTVTGGPSGKTSVYTYNTDYFGNNACLMQSGFPTKGKGNTVFHMRSLQSSDGESSFATAVGSATIGNAVDILRYYYPNITTIPEFVDIIDKYLVEKNFKYIDSADGREKDGGFFYEFDGNKFIENEVLRINELKNIDTGSDVIDLPSYKGVCYTGKGVGFGIGKTYYGSLTKDNINYLLAAWGKGESVTWTISKSMGDSQGGRGNVCVISVGKNGEKIYEMVANFNKK